jgi:hypothetical protein
VHSVNNAQTIDREINKTYDQLRSRPNNLTFKLMLTGHSKLLIADAGGNMARAGLYLEPGICSNAAAAQSMGKSG